MLSWLGRSALLAGNSGPAFLPRTLLGPATASGTQVAPFGKNATRAWHSGPWIQESLFLQGPKAGTCRWLSLCWAEDLCVGAGTSKVPLGAASQPSLQCPPPVTPSVLGPPDKSQGGAVLLPLGPTGTSSTPVLTQCSLFIFPTNDPAFEIKCNKSDVNSALQSPESALLLKTRQPRERFQEKERALVGEDGTPPGVGRRGSRPFAALGRRPLWPLCAPPLQRAQALISEGIAGIPTSVGTATPSAAVWLCCPLLMGRRTPNPNNCRAEKWSWGPRWQLSPPGLVNVLGAGGDF